MTVTEADLKKFSVSNNIYRHLVLPLFRSGNVQNPDAMLDLLKSLTSSLWTKTGIPNAFSGAVAGTFAELVD
jgi:hypothetical protein